MHLETGLRRLTIGSREDTPDSPPRADESEVYRRDFGAGGGDAGLNSDAELSSEDAPLPRNAMICDRSVPIMPHWNSPSKGQLMFPDQITPRKKAALPLKALPGFGKAYVSPPLVSSPDMDNDGSESYSPKGLSHMAHANGDYSGANFYGRTDQKTSEPGARIEGGKSDWQQEDWTRLASPKHPRPTDYFAGLAAKGAVSPRAAPTLPRQRTPPPYNHPLRDQIGQLDAYLGSLRREEPHALRDLRDALLNWQPPHGNSRAETTPDPPQLPKRAVFGSPATPHNPREAAQQAVGEFLVASPSPYKRLRGSPYSDASVESTIFQCQVSAANLASLDRQAEQEEQEVLEGGQWLRGTTREG